MKPGSDNDAMRAAVKLQAAEAQAAPAERSAAALRPRRNGTARRRATVLLMIVGLLAMLFILVSAYIVMARQDRITQGLAANGERVNQMLNALDDLVSDRLRSSDPAVPGGRMDYPQIPGFYNGALVAGADLIRDPNAGTTDAPFVYWYQPSSLVQRRWSAARRLDGYLIDANGDGGVTFDPRAFSLNLPGSLDMAFSVQNPYFDAVGTGMPNSYFGATAWATELVNGIAGTPVRATGIDPSMLTTTADPNTIIPLANWQAFTDTARYVVSMNVQPHGGMLQLALDPRATTAPWNAAFVGFVFNGLKSSADPNILDPANVDRQLLQRVAAQRDAIESVLRRRGGLLAVPRSTNNMPLTSLPPALDELESKFRSTFWATQGSLPTRGSNPWWQRFNLTDLSEWNAYRQAMTVDPIRYITNYNPPFPPSFMNTFAAKRLMTTINNSDDLAWVQMDPTDTNRSPSGSTVYYGLKPGQLKFYLGKITDTTRDAGGVELGAFRAGSTGYLFNDDTPSVAAAHGTLLVRQLLDHYYEMLCSYDDQAHVQNQTHHGWGKDDPLDPNQNATNGAQSISRWRQACMLAVNTVAAAAPRLVDNPARGSYFDAVHFTVLKDPYDPASPLVTYYGYAPQPFISGAIAYNRPPDPDPNDPNAPLPARVALLIELYNPYDPTDPGDGSVPQDLDPNYFAISVNNEYDPFNNPDPNMLAALDGQAPGPMPLHGRSYQVYYTTSRGQNTWFQSNPPGQVGTPPLALDSNGTGPMVSYTDGGPLVIKLWRFDARKTRLYQVDQFQIPTKTTLAGGKRWWTYARRDTSFDAYLGKHTMSPPVPGWTGYARWRMVMAFDGSSSGDPNDSTFHRGTSDPNASDPNAADPNMTLVSTFGFDDGAPSNSNWPPPGAAIAPSIPLYTMNPSLFAAPAANMITLHGVARPKAFPTVGFLQFVPRFSHLLTTETNRFKPANWLLREQWVARKYAMGSAGIPQTPPIDFGHMPIFDNTQNLVFSQSVFDPNDVNPVQYSLEPFCGVTPWGQLVFDYFTTNDPSQVDPYRIPGRIDINAASWYLLSLVPAFGPASSGDLPFKSAGMAPAFWSMRAGILAGSGSVYPSLAVLAPRQPSWIDYSIPTGTGEWYHTTPHLAAAIAEYRDRRAYVPVPGLTPGVTSWRPNWVLAGAYDRNGASSTNPPSSSYPPQYRDKSVYGSPRRELQQEVEGYLPARAKKTGFVSVGELASVNGFENHVLLDPTHPLYATTTPGVGAAGTATGGAYQDDFMRAVSTLVMLDTHFLTVRSNTYTIYTTLIDRKNPQASVRSQVTVDRTNTLPRAVSSLNYGTDPMTGLPNTVTIPGSGVPEAIGKREVSYFNAKYDD